MSERAAAAKRYLIGLINSRRGIARGSLFSRLLGTVSIILFAFGVGTTVSRPNSKADDALCISNTPALTRANNVKSLAAEVGLLVGKQAPAFSLPDQNDSLVSLPALLKKGPVVIVFYRSADWCPYCKQQLVDLQRNLKEIETSGVQLVGISYDSVPILKRFAKNRITFPLLSDARSRTIDAYDVRDKSGEDGVSYHTTFVVDKKGIVRAKLYQVTYAERSAVDALMKAITEAR